MLDKTVASYPTCMQSLLTKQIYLCQEDPQLRQSETHYFLMELISLISLVIVLVLSMIFNNSPLQSILEVDWSLAAEVTSSILPLNTSSAITLVCFRVR